MKITDRQIAVFGVVIACAALYYGYLAGKQNREIIAHTKEIKKNLS